MPLIFFGTYINYSDIPMLLGTPGNQGVFDATDGADSDSDSTVHSWESDVERPHP